MPVKKQPSPAQLAARKKFAAMAKSGELAKKRKAATPKKVKNNDYKDYKNAQNSKNLLIKNSSIFSMDQICTYLGNQTSNLKEKITLTFLEGNSYNTLIVKNN